MKEPGPDHPITIAPNLHRVRVVLGGFIVAESTRALTLREASFPPVHYIPREDVRMDLRDNAGWSYEQPYPAVGVIASHLAFYPDKVDAIEELRD